MEIKFIGNKPEKTIYAYAVKENNDTNKIEFLLDKVQEGGKLDLANYIAFAKIRGANFVDKVPLIVEIVEEKIKLSLTLQRKHTSSRGLDIQLQFEYFTTNENVLVWQTEIFTMVLSDTIPADEEIANKYPAILQDHERRISDLEQGGQPTPTKESKEFVFVQRKGCSSLGELNVILKSNVNCAFTGANKTRSKGQWINCYGTKLGNKFQGEVIEQGEYLMEDFLSLLFLKQFNVVRSDEMGYQPIVLFPAHFKSDYEKKLYHTTIQFVADYEDSSLLPNVILGNFPLSTKTFKKMSNKFGGFLEELDDLVYQTKVMVKFVKDFEKVSLPKGAEMWKGNMAKNWLELQLCFVYNKELYGEEQIEVFVLPIEKRFS